MPETNIPQSVASISPQADAPSALAENLARVEEAIRAACRAAQRPRAEVELMAVTKTHPAATIRAAAELGLTLIGENRVQEFSSKVLEVDALRAFGLRAHLIGHLQTNKAKYAVRLFDCVHSVDRLELAQELGRRTNIAGRKMNILIEVNVSGEQTKNGVPARNPAPLKVCRRVTSHQRK